MSLHFSGEIRESGALWHAHNSSLTQQSSSLLVAHSQLQQRMSESTFVHQIFGSRLRSRVKSSVCDHTSDKIDSVLDLSVDVGTDVEEALRQFTKVQRMSGPNKYLCVSFFDSDERFDLHAQVQGARRCRKDLGDS